jgi:hypothetical protein
MIIRGLFWRRTAVSIIALSTFSIYFMIYLSGRSLQVRDFDLHAYFSGVISFIVYYNLYYLVTKLFRNINKHVIHTVKFSIFFLMIFLFFLSTDFLRNFMESSSQSFTDILVGNANAKTTSGTLLSYENRIFFFKTKVIQYILLALIAALIELGCWYIVSLQQFRNREKELKILKLKEQLTKAQLDTLSAKVNPHFLYNSLNSIAGLALTDGQKTQQMAVSLSKFFRYSINHKEDNLVTVGEELEMVEIYLKIEQIRFEERLNFEVIKAPGTEEKKIPRFILQPLVENSVKHGMKGNEDNLFIRVRAQMEGKKLSLSVGDDGEPFGDDLKPGYGLKSIYDKLDILFPPSQDSN